MPITPQRSRALMLALLASALQCTPGLAHEPDAEEIELGALADADLALGSGRWAPAQAGVARSRDLGFTTGSVTTVALRAGEQAPHRVYFSVWERDRDGHWTLLARSELQTPGAVDFAALGETPHSTRAHRTARTPALSATEARAFDCGSGRVTPTCYARLLAKDVRLYRDAALPLAHRPAVASDLAGRLLHVVWAPRRQRVSSAGDMAVTWGDYRATDRSGREERGAYVHLWLRDERGGWQLAYDVTSSGTRTE